MGIRKYKPTSAGRRNASVSDFADLTPGAKPEKSLLKPLTKKGGRNNQGKITARHRGGGHKRNYRVIDFLRKRTGSRPASRRFNMIRTGVHASPCCITSTAKSGTSWRRMASRRATASRVVPRHRRTWAIASR